MSDYTILLIDYEPRSIESTRRALERAGYRVEVAKDGITGIETFHRLNPGLTLIEAMLPKKHGFEVCQELKRTEHGKQSPVVIMTSVYRGRKYQIQAKHHYRCDGYLEKPVSDELLLSTVEELLVKTAADGAEPIAAADVPENVSANVPELDDAGIGDRVVPPSEATDSPASSLVGRSDKIVPIESGRPPLEREPRHRPHFPAATPGLTSGGGAQPAVARLAEPGAEPVRPEPALSPELSQKRGRALLWVALALLAALAALLLAILLV